MALIKNAKGRKKGSGYTRVFDDADLGELISRIHATTISSGTELERIIKSIIKSKGQDIENLDKFLEPPIMPDGVWMADKKQIKACETIDVPKYEPDFMIFKRRQNEQMCHVVELKDGDAFDTKKASGESGFMRSFIDKIGPDLHYKVEGHFCCFNQDNKQAILDGFKGMIPPEQVMTGKEFCDLLELDYDEIVESRKKDCLENKRYFLNELVNINSVKKTLTYLLK